VVSKKLFKSGLKLTGIAVLGTLAYFFLLASDLPKNSISVDGTLFGQSLSTSVDNDLAKRMLTNPLDSQVLDLYKNYDQKPLTTETLAAIAEKYSMDVATFYFLQKTYQTKENKAVQDKYQRFLAQQHAQILSPEMAQLQDNYLVFIPGIAYKEDTTTGADFATQRRLLSKNNVKNELIETGEWDLSGPNAEIIAARLKILNKIHKKIVVVSASKGSLELAIALGKLMQPEDTESIKTWISICGIIRGSPVADIHLSGPKSWYAGALLWTKGQNLDFLKDLSYDFRKRDYKNLDFPKHLKIVQLIAAPLATQISKEISGRYTSMLDLGPNDGVTPLIDELIDNGTIVVELGLDHYFRDPHIEKKTMALALAAIADDN
jgi:hypothetical protein